jgi:hypothetical protein
MQGDNLSRVVMTMTAADPALLTKFERESLTATQPAEQRKATSVRSSSSDSGQGDTAALIFLRSDALLPCAV